MNNFVCWNPIEVQTIIRHQAETPTKSAFLAVHTPHPIHESYGGSQSPQLREPNEFLDRFLNEKSPHINALIRGRAGSGKTETIRWAYLKTPQSTNRKVASIERHITAFQLLKRLTAFLPEDQQESYNNKITQMKPAALNSDKPNISEFLSALAEEFDEPLDENEDSLERALRLQLKPLFLDPHLRNIWWENRPVLNRLAEQTMPNQLHPIETESDENDWSFTIKDLPTPQELTHGQIENTSIEARSAIVALPPSLHTLRR